MNIFSTIIVAIIAILVVKNWDWIERRFEDLWAGLGKILKCAIRALLVWGGAGILHWLFHMDYVTAGIISFVVLLIYMKRN